MLQVTTLLLALLLTQASSDPGAVQARETAYARVATAEKIAADPDIVRALKAKNAAGESKADIQRKDKEWRRNPKKPSERSWSWATPVRNACA